MTKQIFTQSQQPEEEEILPKQEFYNVETTIDNEPLEGELLDEQFEQIVKPKSSGWKTALKLTALCIELNCTLLKILLYYLSPRLSIRFAVFFSPLDAYWTIPH